MNATAKSKTKKTFPLEIEENLHKALKHKAIESDMSLHAYIIDVLVSRVNEETAVYNAGAKTEENRGGKWTLPLNLSTAFSQIYFPELTRFRLSTVTFGRNFPCSQTILFTAVSLLLLTGGCVITGTRDK